jgi:CHAT domain-containing protein
MTKFYDNLWVRRQPPSAARRNAKLALLRSERFSLTSLLGGVRVRGRVA